MRALLVFALGSALAACASGSSSSSSSSGPSVVATATAAATSTAARGSAGGAVVAQDPPLVPVPAAGPTSGGPASGGPTPTPVDPTPRPEQPGEPPRRGTAVLPENASASARDLAAITPILKKGVLSQPFGKTFAELAPRIPEPKDTRGLGGTASPPEISNDPIEVQSQVQYLEETKVEARYGHVSIRVVRVFRYGKLGAAQLVLDRIGREPSAAAAFEADVAALSAAWKRPLEALGIDPRAYRVARSDLFPLSKDRPLRITIEPEEGASP